MTYRLTIPDLKIINFLISNIMPQVKNSTPDLMWQATVKTQVCKILYKNDLQPVCIRFMNILNIKEFYVQTWVPSGRHFIIYTQITKKFKQIWYLKQFWRQALWRKDTWPAHIIIIIMENKKKITYHIPKNPWKFSHRTDHI